VLTGSVSLKCYLVQDCNIARYAFPKKKNEGRMSILDVITEQRRADVAAARLVVSEQQLRDQIRATEAALGPALDVLDRLNAPVVSDVRKRRSIKMMVSNVLDADMAFACMYFIY
jgi:hypothetical protein